MKKWILMMCVCASMFSFAEEPEQPQPATEETAVSSTGEINETDPGKYKKKLKQKIEKNKVTDGKGYFHEKQIEYFNTSIDKLSTIDQLKEFNNKVDVLMGLIDESKEIMKNHDEYKKTNGYDTWTKDAQTEFDKIVTRLYHLYITTGQAFALNGIDGVIRTLTLAKQKYYSMGEINNIAKDIREKEGLNDNQKNRYANNLLKNLLTEEEIQANKEKAEKLNEQMILLRKAVNGEAPYEKPGDDEKITDEQNKRYETAIEAGRVALKKEIEDVEEIKKLIKEIEDAIAAMKNSKKDLKGYREDADALYLNDVSVINQIDKNFFIKAGTGLVINNKEVEPIELLKNIGEVSLGINQDIKGVDGLRLGVFTEYKYQTTHNVSLGITGKYKDFSSFVRYRISILPKSSFNALNHNVDLYARYSKDIEITSNYGIEPNVGVNVVYSSGTYLNKLSTVKLEQRVGFTVDAGARVYYKDENIKVYLFPEIMAGYNDQVIVQENVEGNSLKIDRKYFNYSVELGTEKEVDKFLIGGSLKVEGSYTSKAKFTMNLLTGYQW